MYTTDLQHLGDKCEPYIIINDILQINKTKTLFMLAKYEFNTILQYLKDGDYESIYTMEKLEMIQTQKIRHKKYGFIFIHDFVCDVSGKLLNYDTIVRRFDEKIANFKGMFIAEKPTIFINFTRNASKFRVRKMLEWFRQNATTNKKIAFIIFTEEGAPDLPETLENVFLVKLIQPLDQWWEIPPYKAFDEKIALYKEIYGKFIECCDQAFSNHDFPRTFLETGFEERFQATIKLHCPS